MTRTIGISINIIDGEDATHTSFYFGGATVEQLYAINSELDLLKLEIIERIKESPKDYEIKEFGDDEENHS